MAYPDLIERLLWHDEGLNRLEAPETVQVSSLEVVRDATPEALTGSTEHPQRAELLRATLLYFCGSLEEAHRLAQNIPGDLAAYLHGMIHRRELDFENARYWFRRAGELPFFGDLHRRGAEVSEDVARQLNWDPYLFSTLCERSKHLSRTPVSQLVALQKAEFASFLDYTFRAG